MNEVKVSKGIAEKDMESVIKWTNVRGEGFLRQWAGPTWDFPLKVDEIRQAEGCTYSVMRGNQFLGMIQEVSREKGSVHIGRFLLNPDETGKGIGTEALKGFCKALFEDIEIHTITLNVCEENSGAIKCYENCGFTKTGEIVKNGQLYGYKMQKRRGRM